MASSSFSSPYQDNDESLKPQKEGWQKFQNSPNNTATCKVSEELYQAKRDEEMECLKETFDFMKLMVKKLKRSQAIVNTSMVFFLKYTRIYSFTNINKFLVASACLLLGAKCRDEPVPIEYLVEWYIYFETKRVSSGSRLDISADKKEEYSNRIQEQEFDILCEIGFDCEVDLPNKYITKFAQTPFGKALFAKCNCSKIAYMFMNDSFMTTCALYYTPQQIAAAAIYMAYIYISSQAKGQGENKPDKSALDNSEWLAHIDESLELETIVEVKDEIKKVYAKKPSTS